MTDIGRDCDECIRILPDVHVLSANPELCSNTPSRKHAVSMEEENAMRFYGCELIQNAAIQLQLSTATSGTAQILFHRFYFRQSMRKYSVERMAPACLYLAAKVEEQPQPISNVLEIFQYMTCARLNQPHVSLCEQPDAVVGEKRADLAKMESLLLTQLGFIIHTELPYKFLCAYLDFLGLSSSRELAQRAWNYANDVFRSDACVRYDAPTLACACIHLAAADLSVPLPCDPPWWLVFNVTDVGIACVTMILQQLLDAPRAFNVLEPPPPAIVKAPSNDADISRSELSRVTGSLQSGETEGGSNSRPSRRDELRDSTRGERSDSRGDSRERARRDDKGGSDYYDDRSRRGRNHRDDQYGSSDHRGRYSLDDDRCSDRDARRDGSRHETRHSDRAYRSGRDSSAELQRDDHHERNGSRSNERSEDRQEFGRGQGVSHRDGRHEGRVRSGGMPLPSDSCEVPRRASHDDAHDGSKEKGKCLKADRRAGRWDES